MASVEWSDLPHDLLPVVCAKLPGSLHRIRFAAVCRSWPAAAPSGVPWLVFSRSIADDSKIRCLYCPEDGIVLRIPLPSQAIGKCFEFVGAYDGGWVAALGHKMQLAVFNLFSGAQVRLPSEDVRGYIRKVVFSEPPTSSGSILAAVTHGYGVALCGIGCPDGGWTVKQLHQLRPLDIVFSNGQLYGLTICMNLIKFEIHVKKDRLITFQPHRLPVRLSSGPTVRPNNIIQLHGKLAMVVRYYSPSHATFDEPFFMVFVLANDSTPPEYSHRWEKVTSLGEYTLFLGKTWSKTVYVPDSWSDKVQRSCIYTNVRMCSTRSDDNGKHIYPMQYENRDNVMWRMKSPVSYVVDRCGMWVLPPNI